MYSYKLLATAPDITGITKIINEYWYSNDYRVESTSDPKEWRVMNGRDVIMDRVRVILRKGRYRFELVI